MNLWKTLKQAMMLHSEQELCEYEARISYGELVVFSEMFAQKLKGEECCVVLCASELANAMGILSCFAAGVTAVPMSMRYGKQHCDKILDLVSPTALITDVRGELQLVRLPKGAFEAPEKHPAVIMCTSGTTGKPKGVMLSEQNLLTNATDILCYFTIKETDSVLISRPLYHSAVLTGELIVSLLKGCRIVFNSDTFNPQKLLMTIQEVGATVFCGTPTMINMMARFKPKDYSHQLRYLCISGECMTKEVGRRIRQSFQNVDIFHVYGLTEASPRVTYLPTYLFDTQCDCVGLPLQSVSLKIMKSDETEAKAGEEGVLWIRGDSIMLGYYKAPKLTSKVLKEGWLCTGDMAVIGTDGLLRIKGRSDDLIIRAGMNIYPQEIEGALKKDPRTKEVLVFGMQDSHRTIQIAMKIVGEYETEEEVRRLCKELLPPFQIPSRIELVDMLPKNGSGKIMRGKCE